MEKQKQRQEQKQQHSLEGSINDDRAKALTQARDAAMRTAPPPAPHWPFPIREPHDAVRFSEEPKDKPGTASVRRHELQTTIKNSRWANKY